jgi:hypothetical protein
MNREGPSASPLQYLQSQPSSLPEASQTLWQSLWTCPSKQPGSSPSRIQPTNSTSHLLPMLSRSDPCACLSRTRPNGLRSPSPLVVAARRPVQRQICASRTNSQTGSESARSRSGPPISSISSFPSIITSSYFSVSSSENIAASPLCSRSRSHRYL